jgi:D-amino-acid dehydrogenase
MRVAVVGSGIVGASCAYTACSLGTEVVLVDAGLPGQATAAGAGIVCPWWSELAGDPVWYEFACAAARYYPELLAELAGLGYADVGYRQVGALILAESPEQQAEARQRFLAQRDEAPEIGAVDALTGAEASRLFLGLSTEHPAVLVGGGWRVDGRQVAAALARAAAEKGAVIRIGHAELARRSGRAVGVTVGGELIEADTVIAAAGAWSSSFLPPGMITVEPQRGQIAHFSVEPADTSGWPVVLPAGHGHYLVAFDDHRVVAGATRETGSGFDYRVTAGGLAQVLREALAMAPGLAQATHLETRVGFRPMSPDGRPVLGPVPGTDGLVVATGLGPTGLTMGPYAGAIAARVALGEPPGTDLSPFSPVRVTAADADRRPPAPPLGKRRQDQ